LARYKYTLFAQVIFIAKLILKHINLQSKIIMTVLVSRSFLVMSPLRKVTLYTKLLMRWCIILHSGIKKTDHFICWLDFLSIVNGR